MIGHDLGNEAQVRGAPGIERQAQQDQLGRTDVPDPCGNGAARSKFRHHGKIDERHLELRALARVHEVTVRQHGGPTADGGALHGCDQRLAEIEQRVHQPSLRRVSCPWRILQEIVDVVARTERIACAMPEHDTCALVLGRVIEDIRECRIHARGHRVSLCRTVQFNAKDASGMLGNDLVHRLTPVSA